MSTTTCRAVASRCCIFNARPSTNSSSSTGLISSPIQHRWRLASSSLPTTSPRRRWQSTDTSPSNPKISTIVDQISHLTLLETSDLVSLLKTRLNIPDAPIFASATPGGPSPATNQQGPPVEEEDDAAPTQAAKTLFNLTLKSFEAGSKPKVIKEIKSMLGLSLVDSKKFVESAPKLMKEGVPKEEGEKILETLKGLGAVVVME